MDFHHINTRAPLGAQIKIQHNNHYVELNPFGTYEKFTSEQYIFISFFKERYPEVAVNDSSVVTINIIELSNRLIKHNFEILNYGKSGIFSLKYAHLTNEKALGEAFLCLHPNKEFDIDKKEILKLRLLKHKEKYNNSNNYKKRIEEILYIIILQCLIAISKLSIAYRHNQKRRTK